MYSQPDLKTRISRKVIDWNGAMDNLKQFLTARDSEIGTLKEKNVRLLRKLKDFDATINGLRKEIDESEPANGASGTKTKLKELRQKNRELEKDRRQFAHRIADVEAENADLKDKLSKATKEGNNKKSATTSNKNATTS